MIRNIVLGLLFGFLSTLLYVPHDPFFQKWVTSQFVEIFDTAFDCHLAFKRVEIDLWAPALVFEDIEVTPAQGSGWSWSAKKYSTRCSWWHLLSTRALDLDICFDNFNAASEYQGGGLAIASHIKRMIVGKPLIPLVLVQLKLNNACFVVSTDSHKIAHSNWDALVYERQGSLQVALHLTDGSFDVGGVALKKLSADIKGEITSQQAGCTMQGSCILDSQSANPSAYTITSSWLDDHGMLTAAGDDGSLINAHLDSVAQKGDFDCKLSLNSICRCAAAVGYSLPVITGFFETKGKFAYLNGFALDSSYQCKATLLEKDFCAAGTVHSINSLLLLKGNNGAVSFDGTINMGPMFLEQAHIAYDSLPLLRVRGTCTDIKKYQINADLAQVNKLLKINTPVKGDVQVAVDVCDGHCLIDLRTANLFALIPQSFYSVTNLQGKIDINYLERIIVCNEAQIYLDQGSISCPHGMAHFDSNYNCDLATIALKLNQIPIKFDPSIAGTFSGQLAIKKKGVDKPEISGSILIDNANINALEYVKTFSQPKTSFAIPLGLDVKIATRIPAHIDAPLVKGKAVANLHIKNTLNDPIISGSCALQSGILKLPYKPLYLEKAQLTFMPGHSAPLIDLVGMSIIKQHEVMVQILGPLDDYQIIFSSNPYLEQHEIVALLLSGNPKGALSVLIPAATGQLFLDYLLHASTGISESTRAWLAPLERVHLVPRFDDQSARGGIRAAFEIAVTDQLSATIQKNFSLTEDTRLEIEYEVSDQIMVRGIRDERRDLNAQVQTRWKF